MTDENTILLGAAVGAGAAVANKAYDDLVHPAAQELGQGLGYAARFIKAVFRPFSVAADCINKKCDEFVAKVEETVESIPPERRIEPSLGVLQPIIAGSWGALDSDLIQALFLNLLKKAMDSASAAGALPVYGEMIKQITSDEAKIILFLNKHHVSHPILRVIAKRSDIPDAFLVVQDKVTYLEKHIKLQFPENVPIYLDNLERLKIINIDFGSQALQTHLYDQLKQSEQAIKAKTEIEADKMLSCDYKKGIFTLTSFGISFCQVCTNDSMVLEKP